MLLATPAPEASNPRQGHGAFDTYRFVTELERAGVPKGQAVMIMEQVLLAISEANTRQIALVRKGGVVAGMLRRVGVSTLVFYLFWSYCR